MQASSVTQQKKGFFRKITNLPRTHSGSVLALCGGIAAAIFITSLVLAAPVAALMLMSEIGIYVAAGAFGVQISLSSYKLPFGVTVLCLTAALTVASVVFPPIGLAVLGLGVTAVGAVAGTLLWGLISGLTEELEKRATIRSKETSFDYSSSTQSLLSKMPAQPNPSNADVFDQTCGSLFQVPTAISTSVDTDSHDTKSGLDSSRQPM